MVASLPTGACNCCGAECPEVRLNNGYKTFRCDWCRMRCPRSSAIGGHAHAHRARPGEAAEAG